MSIKQARIIGMGSYLPERILDNAELEKMVETSDEWITSRTGIKERRIAASDEHTSSLGAKAALKALETTQISADQIDLILVATMTPDYLSPSTATLIQAAIGASNAIAFDLQAACSGFIYALSTAKAFIESNQYKTILLVAAEKMSAVIDYQDRNTCVLFGDGASAAIISNQGSGLVISETILGADGCLAELLVVPGGGTRQEEPSQVEKKPTPFLTMNGKEIFKHAVRRMEQAISECLNRAKLKQSDISWLVPHQANSRILEALSKKFEIPSERVYKTLHKYGNTSASSVAIALDELTSTQSIAKEEHILLVAFGAGLTWGAVLLTNK